LRLEGDVQLYRDYSERKSYTGTEGRGTDIKRTRRVGTIILRQEREEQLY